MDDIARSAGLRADDDVRFLRSLFEMCVAAADPALAVSRFLPAPPKGRTIVIGAGKASAVMAQALEQHWPHALEGLVVTRYGYGVPCERIRIIEAAHPVPDANGLEGARQMLALVQGLSADDLVICLISGGGSALLPLPLAGISLADKQEINRQLLACGAGIGEMNCVRRHLSAIKGGRLAAACHPARVLNLVISDVPGDSPADIASGPTVGDASTAAEARAIIARYGIRLPDGAKAALEHPSCESIKPDDPRLAGVTTRLVITPLMALEAARTLSEAAGIRAHILGDAIEGEARDVAKVMGGMALHLAKADTPFTRPFVLLSGGETTVSVRGTGRGGRNVEFALALALTLQGAAGISAIACDTDGVDGAEEIAGAVVTPDTLARALAQGIIPRSFLDNNDAHSFFAALGDQVITGPTGTNVNDFRAILVR